VKTIATRVAWFRLTRSRDGGIGSLVIFALLVGTIAGLGMAAMAGARATENSYATLLARSNSSALSLDFGGPVSTSLLAKLPGVRHVEAADFSFTAFPLNRDGAPVITKGIANGDVAAVASIDGEYFNQDRVSVTDGRMASPRRIDEFVTTALAERLMGWHVGERIRMGFYTGAQAESPKFGTSSDPPAAIHIEHLVGTVVFTDAVVQDEADQYPTYYLFTPASAKHLASGAQYVTYNIQLKASSTIAQVEREIIKALRPGQTYVIHITSVDEGEVERSIRPEALALGVFGSLAFVAALLTGLQLINRRLRQQRVDQESMRAMGARHSTLMVDSVTGPVLATVAGAVVAYVIAVALSPFTMLGPVRPLLPRHVRLGDSIVLFALAAFVLVLVVATAAFAERLTPKPGSSLRARAASRSHLAQAAMNAGFSAPAVTGIHFAFESGHGRRAAPVRSVLTGLVLAVTMITTTLTFASGLSTLVARPVLFGWNWNYALTSNNEVPSQSVAVLQHASNLVEFTGVSFGDVQIDGVTEPTLIAKPNLRVSPPLLSGHGLEAVNQIVLGAATLSQLHKHLGQTVTVSYGAKKDYPAYVPPTRLTIVGSATLPAVGGSGTLHSSMGVGAIIDVDTEPAVFKAIIREGAVLPGDDMVFVRLRPGVSVTEGLAVMRRAAKAGNHQYAALPLGKGGGDQVSVLGVQYPAEIINYRSTGTTPLWLALAFALGVTIAFGLTIGSSVRQRRRELAVLRTLGFTRRQLGASVAWQASSSVLVGVVIGVPLGILVGRELWTLFARQIYAVPLATVPTVSLVLLGVTALVLANVVAIAPRRSASRTPVGAALRAE
jgi:hypothetical protein